VNLRWSGDTLLLVEFAQAIDPEINERVVALADRLRERIGHAIRDVVPGYCAVGVHVDPLQTDLNALERVIREEAQQVLHSTPRGPVRVVEIEVRYGGADGPDLNAVAEWARCTAAQVIERHTSRTYRVYMLGFVPGFAYLGSVDSSIAAPRHRVPRDRVPAGSVGIAGEQTGVYPISTPGGWQLIGRTSAVMFDSARPQPSLLLPGDLVRFVPSSGAA
jgi:KipI family sensor histidine kinase inhibitor